MTENTNIGVAEILDTVAAYARSMWRFRWWAIAFTWAIAIAGAITVLLMPNRFEANTRVYVDAESVLRPLMRGLSVETNIASELTLVTRALVSRPQLTAVARSTDLDLKVETPREMELLLNSLEERIEVTAGRGDFYTIAFNDQDAAVAKNVVTALLDTFIESTIGSNEEDSERAETALRAQIDAYEIRLNEAENRLKTFKQENVGMMPGSQGDYYERLQAAESELSGLREQISVNEEQYRAIERQIVGEEPVFGIMEGQALSSPSSYDGQIASLNERLSSLLIEFTEKHPDVQKTQSLLEELRSRRQAEIASRGTVVRNAGSTLDENPVYQDLRIRANDAAVELASLRARERVARTRVDDLRRMVDVVPEVESELTQLNRDYGVVKSRYEEMLERWETLQTSKSIDERATKVRFRIVEPPFVPSEPVGPPRSLYLSAVTLVSIGAGIALAFAMALLKPVFSTVESLNPLPISVIGSVRYTANPKTQQARNLGKAMLAANLCFFILGFGALVALSSPVSTFLRTYLA